MEKRELNDYSKEELIELIVKFNSMYAIPLSNIICQYESGSPDLMMTVLGNGGSKDEAKQLVAFENAIFNTKK